MINIYSTDFIRIVTLNMRFLNKQIMFNTNNNKYNLNCWLYSMVGSLGKFKFRKKYV